MTQLRKSRGITFLAGKIAPDAEIWFRRYGVRLEPVGAGLTLVELPGGLEVSEGSGDFRGVYSIVSVEDDSDYISVELALDASETRVMLKR
jgi:hypothetical protein